MHSKPKHLSALLVLVPLVACSTPGGPDEGAPVAITDDGSMRIAALDYQIGDLNDPAELAKFTRAEIVVVQPWQVWNNGLDLELLREARPGIRIIAYFRSKVIREDWREPPASGRLYTHDLYQAGLPYLAHTTTGDTISDWPGTYFFDYTDAEAREAMLSVFVHYQNTSPSRFDGIFWDYFSPRLHIPSFVAGMEGEPDIDGDGIPHVEDPDEQQAFRDGQFGWVEDAERMLGAGFIQIANGETALVDSTFAARVDGMFYERFPGTAFGPTGRFRSALDPTRYNNLWAARNWPRKRNGGPWLLLSQTNNMGSYQDANGDWIPIEGGELNRAIAQLTGATSITYDGSGRRSAGIPSVEFELGAPLGPVQVTGNVYGRDFEGGRIELYLGSGDYPEPFDFKVIQNGKVVREVDFPSVVR